MSQPTKQTGHSFENCTSLRAYYAGYEAALAGFAGCNPYLVTAPDIAADWDLGFKDGSE